MRIAYLILAHKNPRLIWKAVQRLSCADCAFFIHIDGKVNIDPFRFIQGDNIFYVDRRVPVYWSEFSGVEAELILLRQALAASPSYDYFVLISGSDYPLRSNRYIQTYLEANRGMEFMTIVRVPNEEAGKPISRITTLRFPSSRPVCRLAFRALAKLGLANRDYRKYFGHLEPYSGSTWWALTREACHYLLDFTERNHRLAEFFQNTFAPDEAYFHTILGNSPFIHRMRRNLLYEDWSARGGHPAMIGAQHLALLESQERVCVQDLHGPGELLFARKFSDENLELLEKIDRMIERKEWQYNQG